jgi:hypothetical protein
MTERVQLFIDGVWRDGHGGGALPFWNPAAGEEIGIVAVAERHGPASRDAAPWPAAAPGGGAHGTRRFPRPGRTPSVLRTRRTCMVSGTGPHGASCHMAGPASPVSGRP